MIKSTFRLLRQITRRLAVRVLLIAALALLALLSSMLFGHLIPDWMVEALGVRSLDTILNMLAMSMLTVTTFSLSVMTGAIQFASSQTSPRSRLVLRNDTVTQSVLANFVGAFLFAMIGIILRATPMMGEKQSVLLFLFTTLVVAMVVVSILRWINHLETLGSMDATVAEVTAAALTCMTGFARRPALGGHAMAIDELDRLPRDGAIRARADGYVQQIYEDILHDQCTACDIDLYLAVRPGSYVCAGMPLVFAEGGAELGETARGLIRSAFKIDATRSFEQDPLLGVATLTEIASRALSSGINDPQTAIDVVHRLTSVLLRADPANRPAPVKSDNARIWMVPPSVADFYSASFDVIARDGADLAEVQQAIRAALAVLERQSGPTGQAAARACAARLG